MPSEAAVEHAAVEQALPASPPAEAADVAVCLDCGAPRLGPYCQACGQHHPDGRLTLRTVLREFAERFLKLERGLVGTARRSVTDPGGLARAYVAGQRRRYVNPVSFLLIGSAVAVLLIPFYASPERLLNDPSMPQQTETQAAASFDLGVRMVGGDPSEISPEERERIIAESMERTNEFMPVYLTTVSQLYSVFAVVLAVAVAALFKLFFGGRERTYTFAETLVLGCYFAGAYTALTSVLASAMAPFAPLMVSTAGTSVFLVGGVAYAAVGFYGRSWGTAALGGLSGVLALVAYTASVVVIALPVVVVKMVMAG